MSLDYQLLFAKPELVVEELTQLPGFSVSDGNYQGRGFILDILDVSTTQQLVARSCLGFVPTVNLAFTIDKFDEYFAGIESLLLATTYCLSRSRENVGLLFGWDYVILRRVNGRLQVNRTRPGLPENAPFDLIPKPYQLVDL